MDDPALTSLRQQRAEIAGSIYVDLVEFTAKVPPIEFGWPASAAGISATIIDGLAAVVELVNGNGQGHAPTVGRGMIEALLDLALLCDNPDYMRTMILATQSGVKRRLERELKPGARLSGPIEAVKRNLDAVKGQVDALTADGVNQLSIGRRFQLVPEVYHHLQHYYDRWNSSVHNNIEAIMNRHFRDGHLQIGDTLTEPEAQELLIIASAIAIETVLYAHKFSTQRESLGVAERERLLARVEMLKAPIHLAPAGSSTE